MASRKRRLANLAERMFGVRILDPSQPALMERFESEHLRSVFKHCQADCVFDIGANAGQYYNRIRELGFRGQVISFEPIPELASALRRIAEHDRTLLVEQIALDERAGTRTFNFMARSDFSSLHAPNSEVTGGENSVVRTFMVEAQTLNQIYPLLKAKLGFERPFLKLDTQGHDLAVAKGGCDVLSDFVGVQSELSVRPIYVGIPTYKEVLDFYNAHGFQLSALIMNAYHFPELFEMDAILLRTSKT
jgi:FkbM family methyltransferase